MSITRDFCEKLESSIHPVINDSCYKILERQEDVDNIEDLVYIVSGVVGAVLLPVLIIFIVLFIKLTQALSYLDEKDELQTRGYTMYTGAPQGPTQKSPAPLANPKPLTSGLRINQPGPSHYAVSQNPVQRPRNPMHN